MDLFFGGGLNQRDDRNISLEECTEGQNFLLDAQARTYKPRPPFDLVGTTPVARKMSGIIQMIARNDTDTLLGFSGDVVYAITTTAAGFSYATAGGITTSTGMRGTYWSLDDTLLITDVAKLNPIKEWDGTIFGTHKHGIGDGTVTTATGFNGNGVSMIFTSSGSGLVADELVTITGLTPTAWNGEHIVTAVSGSGVAYTIDNSNTTATGELVWEKSVDLFARYAAVWNNRMVLFNITTDSNANPHMILVSAFEDPDNFDSSQRGASQLNSAGGLTGNEAFFLLSPDMRPINGIAVFFNTIIISTIDGRLFKLTGTDSTDYAIIEYYAGSAATGVESIVNVGNDVMWLKRGGGIDRLSAVEQFGDVKADDISRFIPKEVQGISDSIAVYDEQRQRVHWFVDGKVLTLDKNMIAERPELSPWSIYKTAHQNGFNTNAATYIRDPDETTYDIYWGDDGGRIFKLNGSIHMGDSGDHPVETKRKFRFIDETELPTRHSNITGRTEYRRRGVANLLLDFDWGEEASVSRTTIPLKGITVSTDANFWGETDNHWDDNQFWDEGTAPDDKLSTKGFSPTGKGRGFFLSTTIDTKIDFLINRLIL